jgi:phage terminase Nu1 subunit (DNA packaging protein)
MLATGKEFAAHRGVHPSRVSQWKRQGRLVFADDGRINVEASDASLNSTLDQAKGMRRTGNITSSAATGPGAQAELQQVRPQEPANAARGDRAYWDDKAREQKAVATMAELKALQQAGALVPAAGVKKAATEAARSLRNAMLAIPDRISPVLDPGNPARAHKLLTDEIQKALRELSSELEQRAADVAGADERERALL